MQSGKRWEQRITKSSLCPEPAIREEDGKCQEPVISPEDDCIWSLSNGTKERKLPTRV